MRKMLGALWGLFQVEFSSTHVDGLELMFPISLSPLGELVFRFKPEGGESGEQLQNQSLNWPDGCHRTQKQQHHDDVGAFYWLKTNLERWTRWALPFHSLLSLSASLSCQYLSRPFSADSLNPRDSSNTFLLTACLGFSRPGHKSKYAHDGKPEKAFRFPPFSLNSLLRDDVIGIFIGKSFLWRKQLYRAHEFMLTLR